MISTVSSTIRIRRLTTWSSPHKTTMQDLFQIHLPSITPFLKRIHHVRPHLTFKALRMMIPRAAVMIMILPPIMTKRMWRSRIIILALMPIKSKVSMTVPIFVNLSMGMHAIVIVMIRLIPFDEGAPVELQKRLSSLKIC